MLDNHMWPMATLWNSTDLECGFLGPTAVLKICSSVLCENKHHQLFLNTLKIKNHRVNEHFAGCGRMLESKS